LDTLSELKDAEADKYNITEVIEEFCSNGKIDINEDISEKLDYFLSNYKDFLKNLDIPNEQNRLCFDMDQYSDTTKTQTFFSAIKFVSNSSHEIIRMMVAQQKIKELKTQDYEGIVSNSPKLITLCHFMDGMLDIEDLSKFKNLE